MRGRWIGRTPCLTPLIVVSLIAASGCRSTSPLPSGVSLGKPKEVANPSTVAAEIAWQKAPGNPSAAYGPDAWKAQANQGSGLRAAAFQLPLQVTEPPIATEPPVVQNDKRPRHMVQAQPVSLLHGDKHHGGAAMPLAPLPDAPNEANTVPLPMYVIRPPDVLLIDSQKGLLTQPIRGQHLVRPDGTVGLGIYGPAMVAGRTIMQAREEIARVIHSRLDPKTVKFQDVLDGLSVDVLAYNSSVYYVITDGAGLGEQVYRFPVTGNETVLDAISNINGLPVVASPKRIWVARRTDGHAGLPSMLPVDWRGITQHGAMNTNWQVMPGDRIYVQADPVRRFNNNLSKFLEPIERVLGVTLLGSQTVNSIRNSNNNVNNNNNFRP
jgi:polysaccharide biosynthesis/export protein